MPDFVRFTAPDGWNVWIRSDVIEVVHGVRLVHGHAITAPDKSGAKIVFGGGFQYVQEPVEKVLAMLGQSELYFQAKDSVHAKE